MVHASNSLHTLDDAEQLLSELEGLERHLNCLRDGLSRSHRLATLGTMAAGIAHEFNNILTPMIGQCDLAMHSGDDLERMKIAVHTAMQGAERAAAICASLLNFTRDGGSSRICCIAQVLEESLTCLVRPLSRDGIQLSVHVDRHLSVAMSQIALQQTLLNLLLNARTAMAGRGGRISVIAEQIDAQVHISVADTGRGIPPHVRSRLFSPFATQPHDRTALPHEPRGTGLGLAVCRELVEQAGGTIRLTRTGETGTEFHITLPAADSIL